MTSIRSQDAGMFLMFPEELEVGFQQALKLAILRGRDQRRFERSIDGLMIGNFVLGIGLVKGGSAQFPKLFLLYRRIPVHGFAGVRSLRRNLQLMEQSH